MSDSIQQLLSWGSEKLAYTTREPTGAPTGRTAVVMHGAGTSDQSVHAQLAQQLAERGCRTIAFDFTGHGASSGRLQDLSLSDRFDQARAVINSLAPDGDQLLLVGASMSGQTVADLTAHYGGRVVAVGLLAPAVYPRRAWPLRFGAGFTQAIRVPQAWRDSAALDTYTLYTGRAVLAVPGEDHVIPQAVNDALVQALSMRADFTHLVLPDADHHLGRYFKAHPDACARFADTLTAP
ncbi:pimeloyl-ACP methyl ester carboxylesterase [Kitasatospora sp. MAA4]|uniref:alpha/beta hydrolase n=1 Tax=Kitasatospora sp. MAA4 TaxID=3035093 RepID=UPI0024748B16|nr:alpha/beta fold hydrolase [Kitasatospora sp. MAA4]MDH6137723.1 pimeloyl-ACP methyl ester carboxylesterase [Kitasatospora sp. MAA4]